MYPKLEIELRESDYDDARQKWRDWLKEVEATLVGLVLDEFIFRRSVEVASSSGVAEAHREVFHWVHRIYATHAAITLRRLLDSDDQTYSLLGLLSAIHRNPQVITREEFVSTYPNEVPSSFAHRDFDQLAGEGEPHLPKSIVHNDIARMESLADRIRPLVDQVVAHHDRNPGDIPPISWDDLKDITEQLECMCIRYNFILNHYALPNLMPTINRNRAETQIQQMFSVEAT